MSRIWNCALLSLELSVCTSGGGSCRVSFVQPNHEQNECKNHRTSSCQESHSAARVVFFRPIQGPWM